MPGYHIIGQEGFAEGEPAPGTTPPGTTQNVPYPPGSAQVPGVPPIQPPLNPKPTIPVPDPGPPYPNRPPMQQQPPMQPGPPSGIILELTPAVVASLVALANQILQNAINPNQTQPQTPPGAPPIPPPPPPPPPNGQG